MKKTIHSKEYRKLISLLREKRENLDVTQVKLASMIDTDQTFISKIENCERRIDVIELRTICKVLKISFTDFIQELEEKLNKH
jgi:transcriptional regulator with XRE-family HTH domain